MASTGDGNRGTDRSDAQVSRRSLLAAGTAFAIGLAGCASDPDDGETPSETTPATSDGPRRFDAAFLERSPGSHVAPTDGFADVDWLSETDFRVTKVTTLANEGKGSLRWAVDRPGTNVVVFEVGGVIDLEGEQIDLSSPRLFVAGQTAPAPGITLIRGGIGVEADDVVLQHLRVRPGDDVPSETDCINNSGGSNVIVDHCTTTWGTDEGVSTNGGPGNPDVTFANNLIAEGLHDSIHSEGTHSYGTLVMDRSARVTIAGNLWANNTGRHPRLKGGTSSVVVNNVADNFERATDLGGGVADETVASIVGNYYRAGELTDVTEPVVGTTFPTAQGPVRAYVALNETEPSRMPVTGRGRVLALADDRPLWPDGLEAIPADDAYGAVLSSAGARPADRTPHDERVVANVRANDGSRIDSQEAVGGYPDLDETTRELDVPDNGVAEWLFQHTRAVELPDVSPP